MKDKDSTRIKKAILDSTAKARKRRSKPPPKEWSEPEKRFMRKLERAIAEHGTVGSPIPGSRFYRTYCDACATPIRKTNDAPYGLGTCEHCRAAAHPGYGGPGGSYADDESIGSWSGAVRAMEGD